MDYSPFQALLAENWIVTLREFMAQGGPVLWWLGAVVILCWLLVSERLIYLMVTFPRQKKYWLGCWKNRMHIEPADSGELSWHTRAMREGWLFEAHNALNQHLNLIKALVSICPMLGLLGTVTGMISVFDVMANQGTSDPRLMASGISMATLPTMAGMVAALAGVFAHARIQKACHRREIALEQAMRRQP